MLLVCVSLLVTLLVLFGDRSVSEHCSFQLRRLSFTALVMLTVLLEYLSYISWLHLTGRSVSVYPVFRTHMPTTCARAGLLALLHQSSAEIAV